jgi:hypothetical protein
MRHSLSRGYRLILQRQDRIHSFLTAEDAEDAEKNAEKTSEAIDPPSLILEHATSPCRRPPRSIRGRSSDLNPLSLSLGLCLCVLRGENLRSISFLTAEDAEKNAAMLGRLSDRNPLLLSLGLCLCVLCVLRRI